MSRPQAELEASGPPRGSFDPTDFIQRLINSVPSPAFCRDPDGRFLACNREYERFVGLSRAEVLAHEAPNQLMPEPSRPMTVAELTESDGSVPLVYEGPISIASGRVYNVIYRRTSFILPDGRDGGWLGILIDVTERKRIETELALAAQVQHEAQRAAQLEAATLTLERLGQIGQEITANLETDAVFEALHRHVGSLLAANGIAIWLLQGDVLIDRFSFEDGQPSPGPPIPLDHATSNAARSARERCEVLVTIPPGEISPSHVPGTRVMLTALFAPLVVGDRVLGVISIQSDQPNAYGAREQQIFRTLCAYGAIALANSAALDELRMAQDTLVQQEKLASLGELVASISHEINTPIGVGLTAATSFRAATKRMHKKLTENDLKKSDLIGYFDTAVKSADILESNLLRAAELVRSFKQVSADQQSEALRRIDLTAYIRDILRSLDPMLRQRGVSVSIDGPPELFLTTLPGPLAQVITNLVQNTLAHAFEGIAGPKVWIEVSAGEPGRATISLRDNGVGMTPEVHAHAFEQFFTTRRETGGTGLGLHIVKNLVTKTLQGELTLETAPGSGTTFLVQLGNLK